MGFKIDSTDYRERIGEAPKGRKVWCFLVPPQPINGRWSERWAHYKPGGECDWKKAKKKVTTRYAGTGVGIVEICSGFRMTDCEGCYN